MSRADELMSLNLDALFTRDETGSLLRVREHDGVAAPRFFLGRTASGSVRGYRHDVNDSLRRELDTIAADDALVELTDFATGSPARLAGYAAILARDAPLRTTEAGPVFFFPDCIFMANATLPRTLIVISASNAAVLRPLLPAWLPDARHSRPLIALVLDGRAVAVCGSVRKTTRVHEAGVEVAVAFRERGYAAHVVSAWARAARVSGVEPLYSTDWHNTASRAVARTLGLVMYGDELSIT